MELILLLQELQQEKTQKQLLSPLPFPTTLPLLSACIAQQKTVIADPVRHLHNLTHDMLITITGNIIEVLNTSYLTDSCIGFTHKMESVPKNTIFGLKIMVKSGLEKCLLKSLHAGR